MRLCTGTVTNGPKLASFALITFPLLSSIAIGYHFFEYYFAVFQLQLQLVMQFCSFLPRDARSASAVLLS